MYSRILLIASSVAMGLAGLGLTFAPQEVLTALHVSTVEPLPVLLQVLGALYVGFAFANWTAKDSLMGGIYGRPLAIGNTVHFLVAALALFKHEMNMGFHGPLVVVTVVYVIFAVGFGWLVFGRGAACQVAQR